MILESKRAFITSIVINIILFICLVGIVVHLADINKKLCPCKPKSCKNIKDYIPNSVSGIYEIEVDGEKLEVRCEMNSASGGWTVFHNRYDGSVNFNRSWTSFENGFGKLNGEFWLGLKNVNKLTKNSVNDLRIEMSSFTGWKKYAQYRQFHVGDSSQNYKLSVETEAFRCYSCSAGDSLVWFEEKFSTFDNDDDSNCAARYGANWYSSCRSNSENNMNGKYGSKDDEGAEFMYWYLYGNDRRALKTMTLMFRQVD